MADMLRGEDTVADLNLHEVKKAIARTRRRKPTNEMTRPPRWYTLGPEVADLCVTLLLWEGFEQDERGIHKSFGELAGETGYTKKQLQGARKLAEDEGLLTAKSGFRPTFNRQRTLYWRLNWWRLHEVVFLSALEETQAALEREGRKPVREELNKRRCQLESALEDLKLLFLSAATAPGPEDEQDAEVGVTHRCPGVTQVSGGNDNLNQG